MTTTPLTLPDRQHQFAQLFQRSQRHAYNLAYRLTGNAADAEDVTQDAFMRAWHHFDRYEPARSFEGWLFRIITNRVIDLKRRQKRMRLCPLDLPLYREEDDHLLAHEFAAPHSDPEQIVLATIPEERLERAMGVLPASYRRALLLCVAEGRTYQEIAQVMRCPVGTVRSRVHRARQLLRRAYCEERRVR